MKKIYKMPIRIVVFMIFFGFILSQASFVNKDKVKADELNTKVTMPVEKYDKWSFVNSGVVVAGKPITVEKFATVDPSKTTWENRNYLLENNKPVTFPDMGVYNGRKFSIVINILSPNSPSTLSVQKIGNNADTKRGIYLWEDTARKSTDITFTAKYNDTNEPLEVPLLFGMNFHNYKTLEFKNTDIENFILENVGNFNVDSNEMTSKFIQLNDGVNSLFQGERAAAIVRNGATMKYSTGNLTGSMGYFTDAVTGLLSFGEVVTQYLDVDGKKIAPESIENSIVGKQYETKPVKISNYVLKTTPENAKGVITKEKQTVKYVYEKISNKINKSAKNITSNDIEKTNVKDELEYSVTVNNNIEITNAVIKDTLPSEVSEPTEVTLDNADGSSVSLEISEVYDKANHIITVSKEKLGPEETTLRYNVKILPGASGKTITNSVTINGLDSDGESIDEKETSYNVSVKKTSLVEISYLNELGESIATDKVLKGKIGESYQETAIEIDGYQYERVVGNPNGKFTETPQTVQFIYKENRFNLAQTVNRVDGSLADEVSLGETLIYSVEVKSELKEANPIVYYKEFTLTEPLDSSLGVPDNLQLVTSDGTSVGTVVYDPTTHTITGKITESDQLNRTNSFFLIYQATVKEGLPNGTLIREKAIAEGNYTNGMIARKKESNEVTSKVVVGDLIFESAPTQLNFGDSVKISQKEEKYMLNKRSGELSVKDLRGFGKEWSMTAKMKEPLIHSSGSKLTDALYYQINGREQVIGENQSALIHNEKTTSANSVIITNTWTDSSNQPFIKIKAGETKRGEYKGIIQWSLQDVPTNGLP